MGHLEGERERLLKTSRGNLAERHLDNLEVGNYLLAGGLNALRDSRRRRWISTVGSWFGSGGKPGRFAESIIDWMARGTAAKRTSISYLVSTTSQVGTNPRSLVNGVKSKPRGDVVLGGGKIEI